MNKLILFQTLIKSTITSNFKVLTVQELFELAPKKKGYYLNFGIIFDW